MTLTVRFALSPEDLRAEYMSLHRALNVPPACHTAHVGVRSGSDKARARGGRTPRECSTVTETSFPRPASLQTSHDVNELRPKQRYSFSRLGVPVSFVVICFERRGVLTMPHERDHSQQFRGVLPHLAETRDQLESAAADKLQYFLTPEKGSRMQRFEFKRRATWTGDSSCRGKRDFG